MEHASLRRRVVALAIDIIVQLIISILVLSIFLAINDVIKFPQIVLDIAFYFTFFCCSFVKDFTFRGASVGKRLLKLKVVDEQTFETVNFKRLFLRDLFTAEWVTTFLMYKMKNQTLGEILSRTIVVKT